MSFEDLKKASDTLETISKAIKEDSQKKNYNDERFWEPQKDDDGFAYAEIRFLPAPEGEKLPWVKKFSYGFRHNGNWYIEDSPTTLGKPDPVAEYNSKVWNDQSRDKEEREKDAKKRKRKLSFMSNILVIKDPATPENEGKVFLYRYGIKIHDKLKDCYEPEFPDQPKFDPTDFWKGANFKLKVTKQGEFPNYDKSEFMQPSELYDGDEKKLKKIYDSLYSLEELISEDKFKPYGELKVQFDRIMGFGGDTEVLYKGNGKPIYDHQPKEASSKKGSSEPDEDDTDDDSALAQLKKLAQSSTDDSDDIPF